MRIVVVEDSVLLREGLLRLLADAGHEVVASLGSAEDLPSVVAAHRPDLALPEGAVVEGQMKTTGKADPVGFVEKRDKDA